MTLLCIFYFMFALPTNFGSSSPGQSMTTSGKFEDQSNLREKFRYWKQAKPSEEP